MQRLELEMPHDRAQNIRLVVGTERWKFAAGLRRGTQAASAEVVHPEDPVVPGVDAEARPHDLGPPSLALRARDDAVRRDAAEDGNDRRILGTHQAEGDARIRQFIAVMQLCGTGSRNTSSI